MRLSPPAVPAELPVCSAEPSTFEKSEEYRQLLSKLSSLFGPNAKFKSTAQARCIQKAFDCRESFIAGLNTGEGKSLVYQLPAVFEPDKWTLVICPYKTLLKNQLESCEALGIKAFRWTAPKPPDTETGVPDGTRIIFAATESVKSKGFQM
jgi:superfamily II DNA helicase RecQ